MVLTLEVNGFIERIPGQGRSIRLLIPREQLPTSSRKPQVQLFTPKRLLIPFVALHCWTQIFSNRMLILGQYTLRKDPEATSLPGNQFVPFRQSDSH